MVSVGDASAAAHLVVQGDAEAEPAAIAGSPDLKPRILADLDGARGPLSRETLRATLRVRNDSLGVALRELEAAGAVQRTPRGWRLVDHSLPVP
ncbi:MAG: hypothetical protein IPM35_28090 [Myxococcales bacterium]|nr:hypothetical protein [Myxococcales bacterium]